MEIELKLTIAPADATALRAHPLLRQMAIAAPRRRKMADIYFDTEDRLLRRHQAGLRVRRVEGGWVQTMKAGGSVDGGLHSRNEWETPVAGPVPDLAALRAEMRKQAEAGIKNRWRKLLGAADLPDRLAPLFTTRVTRTIWDLRTPQGDEIECVFDSGRIECGSAGVAISEIELELKSGTPVALFDVALALQRDIALHIGLLSKSARGYAMLAPAEFAATTAAPVALNRRMTVEQAFIEIVSNCMVQIQSNAAGLARPDSIESLHQMRVGLRRLEAALKLFRELVRLPAELRSELTWLESALGEARDWDVFTAFLEREAAVGDDHGNSLLAAAQAQRLCTHGVAAEAAGSIRFHALMLGFTRWTVARGWRAELAAQSPKMLDKLTGKVEKFARRTLKLDSRDLRERGEKLQHAGDRTRHRVRISAKKMRYGMEFFAALYPVKTARPFVKALGALQDRLGWLNDAAVADSLLTKLTAPDPVHTVRAARGARHAGADDVATTANTAHNAPVQRQREADAIRRILARHSKAVGRKAARSWKKFAALKLPTAP